MSPTQEALLRFSRAVAAAATELQNAVIKIGPTAGDLGSDPAAAVEQPAPAPQPVAPAATTTVPVTPAPAPAPAAPAYQPPATGPETEHARQALQRYVDAFGLDAGRSLLAKHGAQTVSALTNSGAFVVEADAAVQAGRAAA